jgi:hypothetical protein
MSNQIMDIALTKVTGKCDEKCTLKFKYNTSPTCVATNNTTYFSLSYDTSPTSPVSFNYGDYNVVSIDLYFHSVHNFNGSTADGEIIINHKSVNGSHYLMICLPLSKSSGTPNNLLNEILKKIYNIQPGNNYNINLDYNYNLNDIVKYEPYYYYNFDNNHDYICYGLSNSIYVSDDIIASLQNILTNPLVNEMCPYVANLFYNANGPIKYEGDEIYIDCNPVDSIGNEQILFNNKNNKSNEYKKNSNIFPQNMNLLEIIGIFLLGSLSILEYFSNNSLIDFI